MKFSLGISNFLEEISSLPHSVVFLYFFSLITEEGFLSLLAILWKSAFRWVYLSFSPLLVASLLFMAISKASSDSHFNAKFQRIARRDKKAFLSDQCKEIEENNRMGKTRDLFKKIRDTKGTFHAKMGSIKDRNGMDLTEAEDIKRWQEYTEELYKKRSSRPR